MSSLSIPSTQAILYTRVCCAREPAMGSKGLPSVIMCFLILGLALKHVQVEGKTCCPSTWSRNCFTICHLKSLRPYCANFCGCIIISGITCPPDYPSGYGKYNSLAPCILYTNSSKKNDVVLRSILLFEILR
jgi:hypothetical protein